MAAIRLIAKVPTLAAFAYRHNMGLPYVYPDNDLSYAGQLPLDDVQEDRGQVRARPAAGKGARRPVHPPRRPRAELLDRTPCAASAPRRWTPTRRSPPGVAALYGPLHGGANEAVLRMLRRIETAENVPDFLEGVKNREERLMGFGHRVYKNYDPRARIIQQHMDEVLRGDRVQPAGRDRPRAREARARRRATSPRASSTRTSTTTRGSSTRRSRSRPRCSR